MNRQLLPSSSRRSFLLPCDVYREHYITILVTVRWGRSLRVRPHPPHEKRRGLGVLLGPSQHADPATGEQHFTLDILDLDTVERPPVRVSLDFPGHGLAIHPRRTREAVIFGKRNAGGCALDLVERQVVRPIAPMAGYAFYGHGAYSRDGDAIFIVETRCDNEEGVISIRESRSFSLLDVLPTYGLSPHDCHLVEDGRTLVITNSGGPIGSSFLPSVTFVDVARHALLEKHEVRDERRNTGHVAVAADRAFAAVSAPRAGLPPTKSLGGVSLRRRGEPWVHMVTPEVVTSRLRGESLSVAIHCPSRTVVATHPDGDLVTFWSLDRGEFTGLLELPGPRGVTVTLDDRLYVVSYGTDARLLFVQADTFRVHADPRRTSGVFAGAHLYTATA